MKSRLPSRAPESFPSERALADVVLTALRDPRRAGTAAERIGLSRETLPGLVERFVEAGMKALADTPPFPAWRQLGVSFRPTKGAVPRFREALRRAVVRWQARGVIGRFFFMNKPPGMRLRFELTGPTSTGADALRIVKTWLVARPEVSRIEPSLYLAEAYQFGGLAGSHVAHDFHADDSLRALEVAHREARGVASASTEILSLLVVCDLVRRMTDDAWEAWDVWKRMEITGRRPKVSRADAKAMVDLVRPFVLHPGSVLPELAAADRRLVTAAYETNERCAKSMRRLAADGKLLFHLRDILPFWIVFHWNRWGIDAQTALTLGIEGALDPRAPSAE
jgi:thiopeptide-type bacteriocin biosynthesis protein